MARQAIIQPKTYTIQVLDYIVEVKALVDAIYTEKLRRIWWVSINIAQSTLQP